MIKAREILIEAYEKYNAKMNMLAKYYEDAGVQFESYKRRANMLNKSYIHYGSSELDKSLMNGIINIGFSEKPKGGILWASPVDAEYGWKEWCEGGEFHTERLTESFIFSLSNRARILYVESEKDIDPYLTGKYVFGTCPDWELISRLFDGIEVSFDKNYNELRYGHFYSWDVDSLAIWNPEVILCGK